MPEGEPAHDVLREAAEWFAALGDSQANDALRERWQQWLSADPRHEAAWQRVQAASERFEQLTPTLDPRAAVQALGTRRRQHLKALATLGIGTASAWLAWHEQPWQRWMADLSTGVGERHDTRLADGTKLWLNTDTALRLEIDDAQRRIRLLQGEILVESAADTNTPHRPLVVATKDIRVLPTGTRFAVYRHDAGCDISVFEGAAEVHHPGGKIARLPAGRQLRLDSRGASSMRPAPLHREAWTRGVLAADNLALSEVAAELARHQRGIVSCSPAVAGLRLVGAFPLAEPEHIYRALERSLPVRVNRSLPWWVRIEAA